MYPSEDGDTSSHTAAGRRALVLVADGDAVRNAGLPARASAGIRIVENERPAWTDQRDGGSRPSRG